jgi:hypothetical protein
MGTGEEKRKRGKGKEKEKKGKWKRVVLRLLAIAHPSLKEGASMMKESEADE